MKDMQIAGLKLPVFVVALCIALGAAYYGVLPKGMVGAFLIMLLLGELFTVVGNWLPIISTFFGGGAIVCIFGGAALNYYHLLPADVIKNATTFMKAGGFLDFYIAALITGSILGMNRKLLMKACVRYLPCIIAAVAVALLFVCLGGFLFGKTPSEVTAYVGIPIMGGGMGAGAVPISKVFASALNISADEIMSKLVPAVALGNAMAIVAGGLLDRLGKAFPQLSGNGALVRSKDTEFTVELDSEKGAPDILEYGAGIVMATMFFAFGTICAKFFKTLGLDLHPYAYMILAVAFSKMLNIVPKSAERAAEVWYNLVAKNLTGVLMIGIGIAYTDLGAILNAMTPDYLVLCALVVLGAVVGAGIVGHLVGFYFVETAITAGLCMANMGGTGDVAVLTAAKRMELMPFAQISSRLGGAFIILMASFLVPLFFS